jgi:hypothetical protein
VWPDASPRRATPLYGDVKEHLRLDHVVRNLGGEVILGDRGRRLLLVQQRHDRAARPHLDGP